MKNLKNWGTGVALVTPFTSSGTVDKEGLFKLVEHCTQGGVDFLVAMGTTAESATLSKSEKEEVVGWIIEANTAKLPIVLGLGGNNTAAVIEELSNLNSEPFAAILSVAPYYNKPSQEGIFQHFKAIIDHSPLPVILYNVPGRTVSNISAETCLRLAHYSKKVIAVKEASGNVTQISRILNGKPAHFEVLSGDDNLTFPMLCMGAQGVISVSGQLACKAFSSMVEKTRMGHIEEARSIHFRLFELTELLFAEGNPAGVKSGLSHLGILNSGVRLPLVEATDSLSAQLVAAMRSANLM
mgnify:CR=1 FL=1